MVGDNFQKDIVPAAAMGLRTFWLASGETVVLPERSKAISSLSELCIEESFHHQPSDG
ncbi:MAG: hypothetical protein GY703_02230 [Gammaproteobacteria bacterium]|nr:hypothetical protein [Gammaproteobacteria bacterium]